MPRHPARSPMPTSGILESLQARVSQLESHILRQQHAQHERKKQGALSGILSVKPDGLKHQARTRPISILSQFDHVTDFLDSLFSNPDLRDPLHRLRVSLSRLHVPTCILDGKYEPTTVSLALNDSLPGRAECDRAVSIYFACAEPHLCLFDQPSFWQRYQAFWDNRNALSRHHDPIVPCIVLFCALMTHFDVLQSGPNLLDAVALVKAWLSHLTVKRASSVDSLQTHTLLVLCLHLSGAAPEALWKASGELTRSAMIAGLHLQHAQHAHNISQQRLWLAIIELDIQGSLLCGLPPALTADFLSGDWPMADPSAPSTRAALLDTLECRLYGSFLLHEDETGIDDICNKLLLLNAKATASSPIPDNFQSAMLMVMLHRAIITFTRPLLTSPRFATGRIMSTTSSLRILQNATALQGTYWTAFATSCGQDVFQAALIVCCMIQVLRKTPTRKQAKATAEEEYPWSADELLQTVKAIPELFLARASNIIIGTYLKELVALSIVIGAITAPRDGVHAAMQSSHAELINQLSLRTDATDQIQRATIYSDVASNQDGLSTAGLSTGDAAAGFFSNRFDFDFGIRFEEAFPLDPDVFRFDPSRQ